MEKLKNRRPAIFLDRDGVINEDLGYVHRLEDLRFCQRAPEALAQLSQAGYLLIVVSNQSGVARGLFREEDVEKFHQHMQQQLIAAANVSINQFYFCPFHPDGKVKKFAIFSPLRKPGTGMLEKACKDFPIKIVESYLIGDKPSDIDCGLSFGLKTIQVVASGHNKHPQAGYVCSDLYEASQFILGKAP